VLEYLRPHAFVEQVRRAGAAGGDGEHSKDDQPRRGFSGAARYAHAIQHDQAQRAGDPRRRPTAA
jgi:hypothetical protein